MRIGVLTTSYPRSSEDPAGNFVAGLNRYLVRCGHQVEVLAAGDPSPCLPHGLASASPREVPPLPQAGEGTLGTEPREDGIRVLRIPSPLFYRGGAPDALARGPAAYGEAARFSLRLWRLCQKRIAGYQALLSHWIVPCAAAGTLASSLSGERRPHVMIAHSSDIHLLRRLRAQSLLRLLRRRADLVYTAASLVVPGAPGRVVPMGVDTARFAPAHPGEPAQARQRLGLRRRTVLFLGRLVPVKGVDRLLLSCLRHGGDHDLLIAGEGPERKRLERLAAPLQDRVRFLGEVGGALRRDLLLGADLLVLPSLRLPDGRSEGAPTVVLEALSAGCPVVASDVGGVAELLGDAGLIVPPGDPALLAAALRQGLEPGWREERGRRALQRARRHDWHEVGPLVLKSWENWLS